MYTCNLMGSIFPILYALCLGVCVNCFSFCFWLCVCSGRPFSYWIGLALCLLWSFFLLLDWFACPLFLIITFCNVSTD